MSDLAEYLILDVAEPMAKLLVLIEENYSLAHYPINDLVNELLDFISYYNPDFHLQAYCKLVEESVLRNTNDLTKATRFSNVVYELGNSVVRQFTMLGYYTRVNDGVLYQLSHWINPTTWLLVRTYPFEIDKGYTPVFR